MSVYTPVFNTTCSVWHAPGGPPAAPDFTSPCQLYVASKGILDITPGDDTQWVPPIYLRVPIGTNLLHNDVIECPPGSGWIYRVRWTERVHLAFPNEYFVGILEQTSTPISPGFGGFMLLESGDTFLVEVGGFILIQPL